MANTHRHADSTPVGSSRQARLRPVAAATEAGYPPLSHHRSLRRAAAHRASNAPEHLPSRRAFLKGGLLLAGAGALATACDGLFSGQVDGGLSQPDFFSLRFPAAPGERELWLADGAHARFYVLALTYEEDVAFFVDNERDALTGLIADELSVSTYGDLASPSGLVAAEDRIRGLLDQAYNDDVGDTASGWFQEVELTLTALDPL